MHYRRLVTRCVPHLLSYAPASHHQTLQGAKNPSMKGKLAELAHHYGIATGWGWCVCTCMPMPMSFPGHQRSRQTTALWHCDRVGLVRVHVHAIPMSFPGHQRSRQITAHDTVSETGVALPVYPSDLCCYWLLSLSVPNVLWMYCTPTLLLDGRPWPEDEARPAQLQRCVTMAPPLSLGIIPF